MMTMTTSSSMMVTAPSARNDEVRITKECRSPNDEVATAECRLCGFYHSFVLRHLTFVIPAAGWSRLLLQGGNDADERKEKGDHDCSDHYCQKHNHEWLENGRERYNRIVHLVIVNIRDLQQHVGQLTSFFPDIDHAHNHRRKGAAGFERLHDRFAFLHPVVYLRNGIGDHGIARGITGN